MDIAAPALRDAGRIGKAFGRGAFANAACASAVTFLLALPLAGLRLEDVAGANTLSFRPLWIAIPVLVVFAGRLAIDCFRFDGVASNRAPRAALAALQGRPIRLLFAAIIVAAVALPMTPLATRYDLDLATTFLIYVMLGWGLNIVVGMAGLLDLGYVAFYAAGAYTFAILSTRFGVSFWIALPLCGLVSASLGILLGFPVLRLKGDYLAIVTLGFGEIIRIIIVNWAALTGGPNGISGIPRPSFFGLPFAAMAPEGVTTFSQFLGVAFSPMQRVAWLYYIILTLSLVTLAFTERLRRLPIGRAWEALREDEVAAQAVGLNPTLVKLSAFAFGAMLGGVAGCFFAARQGFVSPESFTFTESAVVLAIVVLGGMGSQVGVMLAAAVLVVLPELGRNFAEFRMLLFGAAMILIMIWRPGGLVSGRTSSVRVDPSAYHPASGTAR
jgi:branched-chain amino acid transport system permease protein